jgi:uncharacterized Zn-binding protein involved in type VI secretion
MGVPAAVMGDRVMGTCAIHLIPNPATGVPQPGPPLPFSAPLTVNLATRVLIGGKPAAVVGSQGFNTPPHVGLHPTDPSFVPLAQQGIVMVGSATVLIEGKPAAKMGSQASICTGLPIGQVVATATTVLIGG